MQQSPAAARPQLKHMPGPLRSFLVTLVGLWVVSIGSVLRCRVLLHRADCWVFPGRFNDFAMYRTRLPKLHTMAFYTDFRVNNGFGYPAPAIWIYRFFYAFNDPRSESTLRGLAAMVLVALALAAALTFGVARALERRGLTRARSLLVAGGALVLSWPLVFAIQRGNIEMLLWLPIAAAVWALHTGRWNLAAVLAGVAGSIKFYPILLLALFLRSRRWPQIALGLAVAAGSTLLSLWYMGPTFAEALHRHGIGSGWVLGHTISRIEWSGEGYDHSIFLLPKVAFDRHLQLLAPALKLYVLVCGAAMTALFFLRTWRLPFANQVLVVVTAMVALPPVSFDYTLLSLMIPLALLALISVSADGRGVGVPALGATMVCLALILGPEIFLSFDQNTFAGPVKSVLMIALLVLAHVYPFPDPERSEPGFAALHQ